MKLASTSKDPVQKCPFFCIFIDRILGKMISQYQEEVDKTKEERHRGRLWRRIPGIRGECVDPRNSWQRWRPLRATGEVKKEAEPGGDLSGHRASPPAAAGFGVEPAPHSRWDAAALPGCGQPGNGAGGWRGAVHLRPPTLTGPFVRRSVLNTRRHRPPGQDRSKKGFFPDCWWENSLPGL